MLASLIACPSLIDQITEAKKKDPTYSILSQRLESSEAADDLIGFSLDSHGCLRRKGWLVVPDLDDLRKAVMDDYYRSRYTIHPRGSKMYMDMKRLYFWEGMK